MEREKIHNIQNDVEIMTVKHESRAVHIWYAISNNNLLVLFTMCRYAFTEILLLLLLLLSCVLFLPFIILFSLSFAHVGYKSVRDVIYFMAVDVFASVLLKSRALRADNFCVWVYDFRDFSIVRFTVCFPFFFLFHLWMRFLIIFLQRDFCV